MCLTIYSKTEEIPQPKIAKRNIIVYKCLNFNDSEERVFSTEDIKFQTPYQGFPIQLGKRYKSDFDIDYLYRCGSEDTDESYAFEVGEGMFHSHASVENAINDCTEFGDGNCVFYAIIPKGALYYEGYFCGEFGYASNELIITKNPAYVCDQFEHLDYFNEQKKYSNGEMSAEEMTDWELTKRMWYYELLNRDIIRRLLNIPLKHDDGYFDIDRMCRRPSHFKYDR
jgi:hypothetical protein